MISAIVDFKISKSSAQFHCNDCLFQDMGGGGWGVGENVAFFCSLPIVNMLLCPHFQFHVLGGPV